MQIENGYAQKYLKKIYLKKIKRDCVETMQYSNDCVEPIQVLKTTADNNKQRSID